MNTFKIVEREKILDEYFQMMGRRKILGVARFSMLFACGVGTGLFFYGVAEPIYHYTSGWLSSSSSSSFYRHHHHHHLFLSPTSISKGNSHHINFYTACWWTSRSHHSHHHHSNQHQNHQDWLQLLYSYPSQDGTGSVQTQVWLTTIWRNKHSTSPSTIGD